MTPTPRPSAALLLAALLLPLLLLAALLPGSPALAQEGGAGEGEGEGEGEGTPPGDADTKAREDALFGGGDADDPSAQPDEGGDDPTKSREDAMFGGGGEAEEQTSPPPDGEGKVEGGGRDDSIFGSDTGPQILSDADVSGRLEASYDPLDLGGQLFLRLDYAALEEGDPESFPLSSQNLLDLYLDARPNDRVRAYVRGRLTYDPTLATAPTAADADDEATDTAALFGARDPLTVTLDQLWMKFDVEQALFVTVGRQRVKWGAGRFWNPTDFLNPQRLDPLAVFDQRLGVDLVRLHLPIYELDANLYGVAILTDARAPEQVGAAGRAEIVLDQTELSVSAEWRKDSPLRLGADVSTGVGWFDLRLEGALARGDRTTFWEGEFAPERLVVPTARSRREDWLLQVVAGGDVSIPVGDEDSLILGAEYFFNPAGYKNADLYPWLLFAGGFTPLYLGQHYAGAYLAVLAPGTWDDVSFTLSTLGNLSDRSFISRFDTSINALTYLSVNLYVAAHYGGNGEFHFGLDLPPVPLVPELADGLHVPPSLLDAGVSVRMSL